MSTDKIACIVSMNEKHKESKSYRGERGFWLLTDIWAVLGKSAWNILSFRANSTAFLSCKKITKYRFPPL